MHKKIWAHIANSFKEAEVFDYNYYRKMTGKERIETMQFLRETYDKMRKGANNACTKRLRRVVKIIQLASGRKQDRADADLLSK